jgi:hypothetical protein
MKLWIRTYQKIPNLSFFALSRKCIRAYFPQGISSFHHFLAKGGLPARIVNTIQMAEALNLPLGSIWWMDSGYEIPLVIQSNKLQYQTFIPAAFDEQTVFSSDVFTELLSTRGMPDVFIDGKSGEPLLAHYGQGTLKSQRSDNILFDCFIAAVNGYLAKRH